MYVSLLTVTCYKIESYDRIQMDVEFKKSVIATLVLSSSTCLFRIIINSEGVTFNSKGALSLVVLVVPVDKYYGVRYIFPRR